MIVYYNPFSRRRSRLVKLLPYLGFIFIRRLDLYQQRMRNE